MFDLPTMLFTLGSVPLFASRTFSASFWVAVAARFHAEGLLTASESLGSLRLDLGLRFPDWLIADQTLALLGVLALVEAMVDKNPDLRLLFAEFDPLAKSTGSLIFNSVSMAASVTVAAVAGVQYAGFGGALWAVVPAGLVWLVAGLRRNVLAFLTDLDEDDDLGVRKLISWAEDGWVGAGTLLLVVLPVLAVTVAGATVVGLWLVQRWLQAREERQRVACRQCGASVLPTAPCCFSCRHPVERPVAVGAFGQPVDALVTDLDAHRLRLLSKKRCLVCATRLRQKRLRQACAACGSEMLPSRAWAESYLAHVEGKLPKTLGICFVLSLVPIVGLIPGVIYYRLGLVSALRAYVPPSMGCMTRWAVRVVNLLLLSLQWVPLLGAFTLPAMCYLNYAIYRRVLIGQKDALFAREVVTQV